MMLAIVAEGVKMLLMGFSNVFTMVLVYGQDKTRRKVEV
jgi:hypothetical protein